MVNETINMLYNNANIVISDGNLYLKSGSVHVSGWVLSYNEIIIMTILLGIIGYLIYDKIKRIRNFE